MKSKYLLLLLPILFVSCSSNDNSNSIISSLTTSLISSEDNSLISSETSSSIEEIASSEIENKEYLSSYGGYNEGLFVEVIDEDHSKINVKYKSSDSSEYNILDKELIRQKENSLVRLDILGLKQGKYDVVIELSTGKEINISNVEVGRLDRSGYAHFNTSQGVGGYNNDGTLKENADVIYVSDETKNSVKYASYTGLTSILKNTSKFSSPVVIRILDTIKTPQWKEKTYESGSVIYDKDGKAVTSSLKEEEIISRGINQLEDGITKLEGLSNRLKYSSGEYDSSYNMLSIPGANNITIEGVGEEAGIYQWGMNWSTSSYIEVRNLTFTSYPEDACSFEGNDDSTTISGFKTGHIWVHNNVFNQGKNNWDVTLEQDKHEGDGAIDLKLNQYITLSYNHHYNNHKTGLVGGSDSQHTNAITFHHNYYQNCSSRLPLGRQAMMHMYNNYYYGSSGTNMSIRAGGYAFVENSVFENVNNPIDIKNGTVKSFNNKFISCKGNNKATIVQSRSEKVSNQNFYCQDFDTNSSYFYYDEANKVSNVELLLDVDEVKEFVKENAGLNKSMIFVNEDVEIGEEPVVNSRYSIVLATAKRARQIIDGAEPMVLKPKCNKPLSIAVEELYNGDVKIVTDDEAYF